jgi:O-methyltransferase
MTDNGKVFGLIDAALHFDAAVEMVKQHHSSAFWGDRMLTLDKAAAFRDDPKFRAAIQTASSSTGANQYASPDGITWRYNTIIWAANQALGVEGDFVECGVYKGDISWVLTEMVDLGHHGRTMYLYDTFAGFSSNYSSSNDFPDTPHFFETAQADYSQAGLCESVIARFANKPYVRVVKGVVPDILNDISPDKIALLHLDMNSPGPERGALDRLYDKISPGGVLVFDDYGWTIFRRQKESADAFMQSRGLTILELPTGQGLAIKSAATPTGQSGGIGERPTRAS